MRTLGVDPGSRATGYGVLELEGRTLRLLASGVIRPGDGPLAERLSRIHRELLELIALWQPQQIALEAVFVASNARSALVLGQARGAALAAFGQAGLPVAEYSPAEVKGAVVGNGRASKPQVQQMVRAILSLARAPVADAADALAAAICHLHRAPLAAAIAAADRKRSAQRAEGARSPEGERSAQRAEGARSPEGKRSAQRAEGARSPERESAR